jgi:hypothetical protein
MAVKESTNEVLQSLTSIVKVGDGNSRKEGRLE